MLQRCIKPLVAFGAAIFAFSALPAPAQAPVKSVPAIDVAGLKKTVAARKGKVVVVNFWATWCGPCREEMPGLVKLAQANKSKGMELVTVAFDEQSDLKTKVLPFVQKTKMPAPTYIQKPGADIDAFLEYLEPKLAADAAASLPRTYIFDRKGKLVKVITNGQSYAQFEKAVAPYLK